MSKMRAQNYKIFISTTNNVTKSSLMFFIKFVPNCCVPDEKIMTSNIVDTHGHVDTQHTRTFKGKSSGQNIHAQT